MFLLGRGSKLTLIVQNIIQPQPTLKVTHDTTLLISKTITKTSEKPCQDITISERIDCIINKTEEDLVSKGIPCLPFYYLDLFPTLNAKFSQYKDDFPSTALIFNVKSIFTGVSV